MAAAGVSVRDVASELEVAPKTVERWITKGRAPHRQTRERLAQLLSTPSGRLWPEGDINSGEESTAEVAPELEAIWPTRSAVPQSLWGELVDLASVRVDVCAYAGLWLFEADAGFRDRLAAAAGRGARVRMTMASPDSARALARGEAEGIGPGVQQMAGIAWTYLAGLGATLNLRDHDLDLPGGLFRADDHLLWMPNHAGLNERDSPVLHLRLAGQGVIGRNALTALEWAWSNSTPRES